MDIKKYKKNIIGIGNKLLIYLCLLGIIIQLFLTPTSSWLNFGLEIIFILLNVYASFKNKNNKITYFVCAVSLCILMYISPSTDTNILIGIEFYLVLLYALILPIPYLCFIPSFIFLYFILNRHNLSIMTNVEMMHEYLHILMYSFLCSLLGYTFKRIKRKQKKLRRALRRMKMIAYYDDVIRIPNKKYFEERLENALDKAKGNNSKLALMSIDLDRFKYINDTRGHRYGDQVMIKFANKMKHLLKNTGFIARQSGDEFIVLLENISNQKQIEEICQKIFTEMQDPFLIEQDEVTVSFSMGVSIYPDNGQTSQELLSSVDIAVSNAKDNGKNRYVVYDNKMIETVCKITTTENDLRKALKNNEFMLMYQPQFDLRSNRITGVEALIRWYNPEKGMISPADFIPIAEETGLIVTLGKWIIRESFKELKSWNKQGLTDITMSVNISPKQFNEKTLIRYLKEMLKEFDLNPNHIELEITEGIAFQNINEVIEKLKEIKSIGFKVAIDDFGTGFSSLSYLKKLPADTIKIDKVFIDDIEDETSDTNFISAIINIAKGLKYNLIAEGVETQKQVEILNKLDCAQCQGYYFSKPLKNEDALEIIKKYNY